MEQGYYITEDGEKTILRPGSHYTKNRYHYLDYTVYTNCSVNNINGVYIEFLNKNIVEISLPNGYSSISTENGILRKITLNNDIYNVFCSHNEIEKITVPSNIKYLWLDYNKISKINLPQKFNNLTSSFRLDMNTPINPYDYPNIDFRFI